MASERSSVRCDGMSDSVIQNSSATTGINSEPRVPGNIRTCATEIYRNAGNTALIDLVKERVSVGRVLDCGCGAGDNARLLQALGWSVIGITISPTERDAASKYCQAVHIADLECGIPGVAGEGFDLIVLSHVIEHLVHPERVLGDAANRLAPGGVLAVALPNIAFFKMRWQLLRGRFDYAEGGIMDSTHVKFYTFKSGAELLRRNRFDIVDSEVQGVLPMWHLQKILPKWLMTAQNRFACRWWPGLFGMQLLYVARPHRQR
jgi:2-polyprenyl-3-methyl-5-hydroxy-6-metoxy-1,4-benzoquinol methylase